MNVSVQRARPRLGTLVAMRVEGLDEARAVAAIDAAFVEVQTVHRCMSFHESASDLSRLHAAAVGTAVEVDTRTVEVLHCALEIAELSAGCFDPTIAAQAVAWGMLPRPDSPYAPDPRANWRDIELIDGSRVRLRRPLWLDLGGIAKGHAVDRAIDVLIEAGATQAMVNAGGDLRVAGPREEIVHLRGACAAGAAGVVAIANAALASSSGLTTRKRHHGRWVGAHLQGRTRAPVGTFSSATVIAQRCMIADALTKVVLAEPALAQRVLAAYGAQVATHSARHGWRGMGIAA